MRALALAVLVTAGCYTGASSPAVPGPTAVAPTPLVPPGPQPTVRIAALYFADHAEHIDVQSLEGWPELAYTGLPAVSVDGTQIAVVEERDGWGHVPVPGIRILGANERWFPLVPPGARPSSENDEAAMKPVFDELVARANAALASTTWRSISPPPAAVFEEVGPDRTTRIAIGRHTLELLHTDVDEIVNQPKPPARIEVRDPRGRVVVAQHDMATTWQLSTCGVSYFKLIGVNEAPGTALFVSVLGMTSHACDGQPQPIEYRVIRF